MRELFDEAMGESPPSHLDIDLLVREQRRGTLRRIVHRAKTLFAGISIWNVRC